MSQMISDFAGIATIVGTVIALATLGYTAYQIRQNTNMIRANYWLELRKMFAEH
jgi:hypothetical protein